MYLIYIYLVFINQSFLAPNNFNLMDPVPASAPDYIPLVLTIFLMYVAKCGNAASKPNLNLTIIFLSIS